MAVIKNNTTTHTSNATLINVPNDGKTRRLMMTVSRFVESATAMPFVGVKVAFAGRNSSTLPDLEVVSYVSSAGNQVTTMYIDNVESGDVTVTTEGLSSGGVLSINVIVSAVLTVIGTGTVPVTPTPVYICQ